MLHGRGPLCACGTQRNRCGAQGRKSRPVHQRRWFDPSQKRCEPSHFAMDGLAMTAKRTTMSWLPGLLIQLIAWPLLGFLIIAFDEVGPTLVTVVATALHRNSSFSPAAGSDFYFFL